MSKSKVHVVPYRRKREGKTNYKKRLGLLLSGKDRLVVRKSLKNIGGQVIKYSPKGDVVVISGHSNELKKLGWNASKSNVTAAYLTGLLLGKKAQQKNIKELIVDIGLHRSTNGSRIYSFVKGVKDAGVEVACDESVLPKEDRLRGDHIAKMGREGITAQFEQIKKNIEDKQ